MDEIKLKFVTKDCRALFKKIKGDATGNWGKMNGQQMVEHVAGFFYVSSGKIKFPLAIPEEHLPKYKAFLLSDKEFRENTKAPANIVAEEPLPVRFASMDEALDNLDKSIAAFEKHFANGGDEKTLHPVFGELNYEEWVLLHYKHVRHHLKQFGMV